MPPWGVLCPGGAVPFPENCGLLIKDPQLNNLEVQKMRSETRGGRGMIQSGQGRV